MKVHLMILLFFILTCLFSCQTIGKMMLGLHNPRIETKKNIYKEAVRRDIDTSTNFFVVDSASIKKIVTGKFPKIYFFNKNGDLILSDNCFELLKSYTDSLYKTESFQIIKPNVLGAELKNVRTFDNRNVNIDFSQSDYVVVYYWAAWMGKLNRDRLGWLDKKTKTDKRKNITLIKVNVDMQKSWNWSDTKYEAIWKAK